jgi:lipoprotein-releasing system permease protein
MVVTDKKADIAILRTLGASARSVMRIFMLQGALSGIIGTSLGVTLGTLVAKNIDTIVPALEKLLGLTFLAPEIYFIAQLPSRVLLSDVVMIASVSFALSFLATIYPSLRAARLQPAEALRYE